jgi:hypothetical protein
MSHRTAFLLAALVAVAIPASAGAATPESGTVSPDARQTTTKGTVNDPLGVYDLAAFYYGSTSVRGNETCNQPVCDTYTLNVADGGFQLRINVNAPASENVSLDIVDPDGTRSNMNTVDYFTHRTFIGEAIPGAWTVHTYGTGDFDSFDYTLTSEINVPGDPDFVPPADGSDATGLAAARTRAQQKAAALKLTRLT